MLEGGGSYGLAEEDVVVGGAQGRGVPDRHLLLAMPVLGVVVLDPQALCFERAQQRDGEVVRQVEPGRRVAQAVVQRDQPVGTAVRVWYAAAEGELRLERRRQRVSVAGQLVDRLLEEAAGARLPRLAVE